MLVENEENVKRDFQLLCYEIQLAVLENKLFVSYFWAKPVSFSPDYLVISFVLPAFLGEKKYIKETIFFISISVQWTNLLQSKLSMS